jgi:CHAD domain-containing protein
LHQFVGGKVVELGRWVPLALRCGDVEAVHQARVTTRRLKAALDLLKPALAREGRRGFSKVLRRLRRSLGPLRDVDVMLGHLRESACDPRHGASVNWLLGTLHKRRSKLLEEIARKRSPEELVDELGRWRDLEPQVKAVEAVAPGMAREALPGQLDSFKTGANGLAGAEVDVHALRIDGKLLRYTLELGQPLGFAVSPSLLKTFKKMQDALGLWHDFIVLSEEAASSALKDMLAATDRHLYGESLELSRVFWQKSERHLGQFQALWGKQGEAIAQEIVATFGLTEASAPATETKPEVEPRSLDVEATPVADDSNGEDANGDGEPPAA